MSDSRATLPSKTHLIAGSMVIGGFLLTSVSWWFLLLCALGTFGPGVLREAGWLRDKDEFQQQALHRAGYHAFLVAGITAFVLLAYFRSGGTMENSHRLASFFLALLWFTWFFSSLFGYWGPQETVERTLFAFGTVWLIFTILSNVGSEWTGWASLLLHPLLAAPFFILAWLSRRRPRAAGLILLASAVGFFVLFFSRGPRSGIERVVNDVFVLFIGPLIACAIVLLSDRTRNHNSDEESPKPEQAAVND